MANAYRDQNSVPTLIASSNVDGSTPVRIYADPVTHRLLVDAGGSSAGIISINGDTTAAQTLTVGSAGTDFAIVDNGTGDHLFNLPSASATARGLVTTGTQTFAGNKTFSGTIAASNFSGSSSGTNTGDQNLFSSIPVSGQTTVTANSTTTALTLVAGTNVTITTDNTAKSVTINSTNGGGTVTAVSVASANGFAGSSSGGATPALTLSTTVNAPALAGNGTAISAATTTGSASTVVLQTSPTLITPVLGVATATSINKVAITAPATSATLTIADGKTLTASDTTTLATNAITLGGGEVITFSASNALSLLSTGTTVMTFPQTTDTVVTLAATQTLTNKRITPRVLSAASYTTDTGSSINGDTQDMFIVTAQTGALKFNNPSGTPTDGQKLIISVASSTTAARALTWDTAYGSTTVTLPTTTAATTATLTIGFIWSASKSLWQCVAVA